MGNLGLIAKMTGDLDEAERLYRECLSIMREIGNRQGEAISLSNLGQISMERGDFAEQKDCTGKVWLSREKLVTDEVRQSH